MATDFELLIQLVHHILHSGHENGMHPKFHYELASDILEGVSSIQRWPQEVNFPFLLLLRMKVRYEAM